MKHLIELKQHICIPWKILCSLYELAHSTIMRWKRRYIQGEDVVFSPGPKKAENVDIQKLNEDLENLNHRTKRTCGSGTLYQKLKNSISRRDLQFQIIEKRKEINKKRRDSLKHIEWLYPSVAWAIDDTVLTKFEKNRRKIYLNTIYDLSARFTIDSLFGKKACGERIAEHLDMLFSKGKAPLIFKRDNAGNLNHYAVNNVLAKHFVIPLNSPAYYPMYNGSIERAQREIKNELGRQLGGKKAPLAAIHEYLSRAVQFLNNRPRRILSGKTPSQKFNKSNNNICFTQKERYAIMNDIGRIAAAIYYKIKDKNKFAVSTANRIAVETWLKKERLIFVSNCCEVSPNFLLKKSHN